MPIELKSADEIALMREAGAIAGEVLELLAQTVRPGLNVKELDTIVEDEFRRRSVIPTFLRYQGYPARVCVSVNDEIVHGIPTDRVLRDGDIVSIDLGATYRGFVGDTALTVGVGQVGAEEQRLIDVTNQALWNGIHAARAGARIGAISHAVQTYAESYGYSLVREYVGHGIGRAMHEDPQVPNIGTPDRGQLLKKGMAIAIEPMVNMGDWRTKKHDDGWTVSTLDGSLSAHFEHTIAITDGDPIVLTQRPSERPLPVKPPAVAAERPSA